MISEDGLRSAVVGAVSGESALTSPDSGGRLDKDAHPSVASRYPGVLPSISLSMTIALHALY